MSVFYSQKIRTKSERKNYYSECILEGDDAPGSCHFGATDDEDNIVGVVSVFLNGNPSIESPDAYQIRAMAASPTYRGQDIGTLLLAAAERHAKSRGSALVWANARSNAAGFYTKSGYRLASEEFLIDGVGLHYLVIKRLA